MMTRAMKHIKFKHNACPSTSNYVNHFLIQYWGWRRPDLSSVITIVLANHRRILSVIGRLLATYKRRTIIGQWTMLEQHLRVLGTRIHSQYFKAHKTEGVVDLHREIVIKAFEASGVTGMAGE